MLRKPTIPADVHPSLQSSPLVLPILPVWGPM